MLLQYNIKVGEAALADHRRIVPRKPCDTSARAHTLTRVYDIGIYILYILGVAKPAADFAPEIYFYKYMCLMSIRAGQIRGSVRRLKK